MRSPLRGMRIFCCFAPAAQRKKKVQGDQDEGQPRQEGTAAAAADSTGGGGAGAPRQEEKPEDAVAATEAKVGGDSGGELAAADAAGEEEEEEEEEEAPFPSGGGRRRRRRKRGRRSAAAGAKVDGDGGERATAAAAAAAGEQEEEEGPHPSGPLLEGDYVWKPDAPIKVFRSKFGPVEGEGDPAELFQEVAELRITHFLGSGAEGTVYKASYVGAGGEPRVCAAKFAGAFPEHNPDTHAAVDLLARRQDRKLLHPVYEREKRAFELLRPRSEEQHQTLASGPVRLVQMLGFHEGGLVVLSELCEGRPPDGDAALLDCVKAFLGRVEKETGVEVGDVKYGNLLRDEQGVTRVIDFGCCHYVGPATCAICKQEVEGGVDAHAQEHVMEYFQSKRKPGPLVRLRLQEFVYHKTFC